MSIPVRMESRFWSEDYENEGECVLSCRSELPELSRLERRPMERINRFYRRFEEQFRRWCALTLYPRAKSIHRSARAASRPFEPWEASLTFEALEAEEDTSVFRLDYVRRNEKEILYKVSQIHRWDLRSGFFHQIEQ